MRLNIIKLLLEYDTHLTAPCAVNDVFSWSRDDVMYTHIGSLSPTPLPLLSHSSPTPLLSIPSPSSSSFLTG